MTAEERIALHKFDQRLLVHAGALLVNVQDGRVVDVQSFCGLAQILGVALHDGPRIVHEDHAVAVDDPAVAAWQSATICREWRGDAHVAVLVATPLTPVEALVLHAATGKVPVPALRDTRGWSDDQWHTVTERLAERGLLTPAGDFTDEGRAFRADIEHRTDVACRPMVEALGPTDSARLTELFDRMGQHFLTAGLYDAYV